MQKIINEQNRRGLGKLTFISQVKSDMALAHVVLSEASRVTPAKHAVIDLQTFFERW